MSWCASLLTPSPIRDSTLPLGTHPDRANRIWPYWKDNITGGELMCPENLFRGSGDIRNSWGSWFGNLATLAPYQDEMHPISGPGCWAYADMLMVSVLLTDMSASFHAEQTSHHRWVCSRTSTPRRQGKRRACRSGGAISERGSSTPPHLFFHSTSRMPRRWRRSGRLSPTRSRLRSTKPGLGTQGASCLRSRPPGRTGSVSWLA